MQAEFERGVAMLHSYWFNYAGKTFRGVLDRDPSCAIGYWGIALDLLGNTLVSTPSTADARAAWDALEKARAVEAGSPRERDWIETARVYFRDHETVPVTTRLEGYAHALEALAARYPDDFEAQVFYALALQAAAPKNDVTYASQLKSARILEGLYAQNPQHPGITHYLIHAYDFAPFADKGIPAARRYAEIAPAVPHARHMPAHIYSMVGLWEDSIRSNLSALEIQPDYYHASDFATYAYLQLAQDRQASALIAKALQTPERGDRPPTIVNYTALAAMPARYALERADWAGAASLRPTASPYPQADALTRFARALGKARTRDVSGAMLEVDALQGLRGALEKSGDSVLGGQDQRADPRGVRLDRPRPATRRGGGDADEAGGGRRGRKLEERGDGESAVSAAGTARRPAPRSQSAGRRLDRIRESLVAHSQPLSRPLWCSCRVGGNRRQEAGRRLLREAPGARD